MVQNYKRSMKRLCIVTQLLYLLFRVYRAKSRLDETQAGIKTARRNIKNLKYAHDTTLMAEVEEELNSLLMEMKEWEGQFLGRLIRSLRSPRRRNQSGVLKEKIGVWSSQGREKDRHFFSYKPRADDCTTKQPILLKRMFSLKLCTNDCITTMYATWGHVSPSWEISD